MAFNKIPIVPIIVRTLIILVSPAKVVFTLNPPIKHNASEINPDKAFELNEQIIPTKSQRRDFYKNNLTKLIILLNELNKDKYAKDILKHLAISKIDQNSEILATNLATFSFYFTLLARNLWQFLLGLLRDLVPLPRLERGRPKDNRF